MIKLFFPVAKAANFFDASDIATGVKPLMADLFADFKPIIILVGGILLGLLIIGMVINFFKH